MTDVQPLPQARRRGCLPCMAILPALAVVSIVSATFTFSAADVRSGVLAWRPRVIVALPIETASAALETESQLRQPYDGPTAHNTAPGRRSRARHGERARAARNNRGGSAGDGRNAADSQEHAPGDKAPQRALEVDDGPSLNAAAAKAIDEEEKDVSSGSDDFSEGASVDRADSAAEGVMLDQQIVDDLKPWRSRGFTQADIATTRDLLRRRDSTVGRKEDSAVTSALAHYVVPAPGIFTITIWRRRVFALTSEARAVGSSLSTGGNWKIGALISTLGKLARSHRLPDVTFLWNVDPTAHLRPGSPPAVDAPAGLAPLMSVTKTAGHWDILVPNTYFRSPAVWNATGSWMERSGAAVAWENRSGRIWFRGASGEDWPFAEPRVRFMGAWHGRGFTDFAFTNHFPNVWGRWQKRIPAAIAKVPRRVASIRYGAMHKMPIHTVTAYRYALHLPGSYRGTYSRALQYLLWTRTLVFILENPWIEFYYRSLIAGVHYLSVNYTNLGEVHSWAEAHQKEAEAIAAAGLALARERLTGKAVADYWQSVLREYASLQRFTVALPPQGSCACFFAKGRPPPERLPRTVSGRCPFICDPVRCACPALREPWNPIW